MKAIHLSDDLALPAEDLLESAIGIIAKRGRGKSGAIKVLMEELTRVGLPFVAFDPVGILWGIRSSFDGKGPGLPVLVIGGEHGDIQLDRKAGAKVAQRIIAENVSCVIDFSEEPKAAYREFVRDFAHELFRRNDTPRLVILEEAPELVPQRVMVDRSETYEAVERLVSRGRNKGVGVVLVSQRAATINKDVLTQVDALLVMGLTSPQDRKALGDWIDAWDVKKQAEKFDKGLAGLRVQEAWFWSPEAFGGIFKRVRIRNFTTFHPDKTHLRRMGWLKVRPVTADVAGVVAGFKGEKPKKEEDVDEKEREQYEDRIKGLETKTHDALERARAADARVDELARMLKEANARAEANAKAAEIPPEHMVAEAVRVVERGKTPGERERVDLHVTRETPNLTLHVREVRVEATTEDTKGRVALLIAEGFFDAPKTATALRNELRARGWGQWIGGAAHTNALITMRQFAEWGFLREDDKSFQLVPEAKERVRVLKEKVAA
jgi:hypothetical protein